MPRVFFGIDKTLGFPKMNSTDILATVQVEKPCGIHQSYRAGNNCKG